MLASRSLYFGLNAAGGAFDPFVTVLLRRRGLTPALSGLILSARPIVSTVSAPMWTALADKTSAHSRVMRLCAMGASASAVLFVALAAASSRFGLSGAVLALVLGVPLCCVSLFRSPLGPLLDSATMALLGEGNKKRYGNVRVWGAVSYGVSGTIVGALLPRIGDFASPLFLAAALLCTIPISASLFGGIPAKPKSKPEQPSRSGPPSPPPPSFWGDIAAMLGAPGFAALAVAVFAMGYCQTTFSHFVPLLVETTPSLGGGYLGLSVLLSVVGEIPLFLVSSRLLSELGPRSLICVAHVAAIARSLAYTVLPGRFVILPQLLHGFTYVCQWVSGVVLADELAPPRLKATAQGSVSAIYVGIGGIVSNAIGGFVAERTGGCLAVFRVAASVAAASLAVFWFALPKSPRPSNIKEHDT